MASHYEFIDDSDEKITSFRLDAPRFCAHVETPFGYWNPAACGMIHLVGKMYTQTMPSRWIKQLVKNYDEKSKEIREKYGVIPAPFARVFNCIAGHCEFWNSNQFALNRRGIRTARALLRAHGDEIMPKLITVARNSDAQWHDMHDVIAEVLIRETGVSPEAIANQSESIILLIAHVSADADIRAAAIRLCGNVESGALEHVLDKTKSASEKLDILDGIAKSHTKTPIDCIIARAISGSKTRGVGTMYADIDSVSHCPVDRFIQYRDHINVIEYAQLLARLAMYHVESKGEYALIESEIARVITECAGTRDAIASIIHGGFDGIRSRVVALQKIVGPEHWLPH